MRLLTVYDPRRRGGGAPVCRCCRTSPAASSWRRGRHPRRLLRAARPCGSRSASACGSGSGSGSARRAPREARRAVKSSEALVMAVRMRRGARGRGSAASKDLVGGLD